MTGRPSRSSGSPGAPRKGAVTDSLVGHAVVSTGPQTLWEACSDLAAITPGVYTASHRTRQLESLWARGLRLEFTAPPVERAWVADISAAGQALAVVCHPPGKSYLVDASTGDRLDAGADHAARVEAMWLTWSRLSYRVLRNALFEGDCGDPALGLALEWLEQAKSDHAATIDWSTRRRGPPACATSGSRCAVDRRSPRRAWRAHRDHRWHLAHWCQTGIPVGALVDGELLRPDLAPHCTPEQWSALADAAAAAPEVTWELSATRWEPGASWHERMYLSPFKSLDEVLGCEPDEAAIAKSLGERSSEASRDPGRPARCRSPRPIGRTRGPCRRARGPPGRRRPMSSGGPELSR